MAYKVEREVLERSYVGGTTRWNVYVVQADTYLELIAGIDEIVEKNIEWKGSGHLGLEGRPHKRNGKWFASLQSCAGTDIETYPEEE